MELNRENTNEISENIEILQQEIQQIIQQKKRRIPLGILICIICFSILLVSSAIILPVLFLIQRSVTFDVIQFNIDTNSTSRISTGFNISAYPVIHVVNDNFFDITLSNLRVSSYTDLYGQGKQPLGYTPILPNEIIELPPRNSINFTLTFIIIYDRTYDTELVFLKNLLSNCTSTNSINLYFNLESNYKMWAQSGHIQENRHITIPCPITPDQSEQLGKILS